MRTDCRENFDKINERLGDGDKHFVALDKDMGHLTDSLNGLTKAIWGACGTALVLLIGFVFWYIQNK